MHTAESAELDDDSIGLGISPPLIRLASRAHSNARADVDDSEWILRDARASLARTIRNARAARDDQTRERGTNNEGNLR